MSLRKLYQRFRAITELPIEITELRDAVVELGLQDEVVFCDRVLDPKELCGVFYRYTVRPRPYADPILKTIIIYPGNAPIPTQRLICAKETIHLVDAQIEQVNDPDKLHQLVEKLLGPLSTEDFGIPDFIAAQDKLAVYRCIPLLFPSAARDAAITALKANEVSLDEVTDWVCLPKNVVEMVLSEDWPEAEKTMLESC